MGFAASTGALTNYHEIRNLTVLEESPTAVVLGDFTAAADPPGIRLDWETASDIDLLGFNLERSPAEDGPWTRLNAVLIPSVAPGSVQGHTYTWQDATAGPDEAYRYRLEALEIGGAKGIVGTIDAGFPPLNLWLPLVMAQ